MKLTYDPKQNVGYIRFHDAPAQVETIRISDVCNVDVAPDGTVYGIELLDANRQLRGDGSNGLVVLNEETGESLDLALPL